MTDGKNLVATATGSKPDEIELATPRFHVEAYGHPEKPDIAGAFPELPDLAGYRWVFHRELSKDPE